MEKVNGKGFSNIPQLVDFYIRTMSGGKDIHNLDERFKENRKKFINDLKPHGFNPSYAHQIASILYDTELLAYGLLGEKTIEGIKTTREEEKKRKGREGGRYDSNINEEVEESALPELPNTFGVRERGMLYFNPELIRMAAEKTRYKDTLEYYVRYIKAINLYTSS